MPPMYQTRHGQYPRPAGIRRIRPAVAAPAGAANPEWRM